MQAQPVRSSAEPLEFRDVTKRYPGSAAPAVDGLSLEVPAGEICVLVGPSGCGKTTAMRMVNRMIDMTSGDILLGGRSVKARKPAELRREIGYVIQQIGLFPHRTIGDNIATVPSLLGWDRKRTAARVEELLELVGLDAKEMHDRYPAQLSGGQRQRVGVARALAADPSAMLMDEPFGAIDPINREHLQDEFLRLQATVRKTIVFVTHDIDEAIKMGDRIAILREGGHLAQYGTPEEILSRPADDFVARFVGTDRGLKRLSLTTLGQLELPQPNGNRPDLRLPASMSARDALSVLLTAGGGDALVVGEADRVHGVASVAALGGLLSDARVSGVDLDGSAGGPPSAHASGGTAGRSPGDASGPGPDEHADPHEDGA
ncbi:MAG TPA: ABC transporter ATP-binding protein [Solirubrobacteraceae bacterium]|nr:ABC transporter ATP-binding protein [Solirubrobacteraceae bacterium]